MNFQVRSFKRNPISVIMINQRNEWMAFILQWRAEFKIDIPGIVTFILVLRTNVRANKQNEMHRSKTVHRNNGTSIKLFLFEGVEHCFVMRSQQIGNLEIKIWIFNLK